MLYAITQSDCHSEGSLHGAKSILPPAELSSLCSGEITGSWSEGSGGPWVILSLTPVERWIEVLNALEREREQES